MSLHYVVSVAVDLVPDLSDADLALVRWLFAGGVRPLGPAPEQSSGMPGPVVDPEPDIGDLLRVPGGARSQLRVGRTRCQPEVSHWSLAVSDRVLDDEFYEGGLAALEWLAGVSATQGLIATAREEDELVPSWWVLAYDRRAYLFDGGRVVPFRDDQEVPEPLTAAVRGLFSVDG